MLVIGTVGGKGPTLAGVEAERFADPVSDLRRAYPPLELNTWLSPHERQQLDAHPDYSPEAASRIAPEGIGAFMIAAAKLRERLDDPPECPEGLAVTEAAVDWRRAGLSRPVSGNALRKLYVHCDSGPDSPTRFERGVTWAKERLFRHSQIALLQGRDSYEECAPLPSIRTRVRLGQMRDVARM